VDVDINALISAVVDFTQFEMRKHEIQFTLQLDKDLPKVYVDSIQFEQVALHLVRNSIEALQLVADKKQNDLDGVLAKGQDFIITLPLKTQSTQE